MSIRSATPDQARQVKAALTLLRAALFLLKNAGSPRAAAKVRLAIKSTDGAVRHVGHRVARTPTH